MAKALGADIKRFYETAWPENAIHEDHADDIMDEQGRFTFADEELVDLDKFGFIVIDTESKSQVSDFSAEFLKWKKKQDTDTVLVTVPKARTKELVYLCKNRGWKTTVTK